MVTATAAAAKTATRYVVYSTVQCAKLEYYVTFAFTTQAWKQTLPPSALIPYYTSANV